uniref:Uncharacterized protein n=1 Tax=Romanomermis culicivorax TaxID=13658 RepID=A0A915I6M6_ROMCU
MSGAETMGAEMAGTELAGAEVADAVGTAVSDKYVLKVDFSQGKWKKCNNILKITKKLVNNDEKSQVVTATASTTICCKLRAPLPLLGWLSWLERDGSRKVQGFNSRPSLTFTEDPSNQKRLPQHQDNLRFYYPGTVKE